MEKVVRSGRWFVQDLVHDGGAPPYALDVWKLAAWSAGIILPWAAILSAGYCLLHSLS
jgi:hypothetical protein